MLQRRKFLFFKPEFPNLVANLGNGSYKKYKIPAQYLENVCFLGQ